MHSESARSQPGEQRVGTPDPPPPAHRRRRRRATRRPRSAATSATASSGSTAPVDVVPAVATTQNGCLPARRSAAIAAAQRPESSRRPASTATGARRHPDAAPPSRPRSAPRLTRRPAARAGRRPGPAPRAARRAARSGWPAEPPLTKDPSASDRSRRTRPASAIVVLPPAAAAGRRPPRGDVLVGRRRQQIGRDPDRRGRRQDVAEERRAPSAARAQHARARVEQVLQGLAVGRQRRSAPSQLRRPPRRTAAARRPGPDRAAAISCAAIAATPREQGFEALVGQVERVVARLLSHRARVSHRALPSRRGSGRVSRPRVRARREAAGEMRCRACGTPARGGSRRSSP